MQEDNPALSIIYMPIDALVPNRRNARTHSKKQIRQIADSIGVFGFLNPVITDNNNVIVAGHGRVEGAKLRGLQTVPTIRLKNILADPTEYHPSSQSRSPLDSLVKA